MRTAVGLLDIFIFGGAEKETSGLWFVHGEGEALWIGGYRSGEGFYQGRIGAAGIQVGPNAFNGKFLRGTEKIGCNSEEIDLGEIEGILYGRRVGVGTYYLPSSGERGIYFFSSKGNLFGGFGFEWLPKQYDPVVYMAVCDALLLPCNGP